MVCRTAGSVPRLVRAAADSGCAGRSVRAARVASGPLAQVERGGGAGGDVLDEVRVECLGLLRLGDGQHGGRGGQDQVGGVADDLLRVGGVPVGGPTDDVGEGVVLGGQAVGGGDELGD